MATGGGPEPQYHKDDGRGQQRGHQVDRGQQGSHLSIVVASSLVGDVDDDTHAQAQGVEHMAPGLTP